MSGNWLLFKSDAASGAGSNDYVRDVFQDVTLDATDNSGLTSNSNTNPLGFNFANTRVPQYGVKTLFIKDLVLIEDRSKWVSNKPTYEIIWNENYPAVKGYLYGNIKINLEAEQPQIQFPTIGDGFGITGQMRRVAFLVEPSDASTATLQVVVDGSNTTTANIDDLSAAPAANSLRKFVPISHGSTNEAIGLHDYRAQAVQVDTLKVYGVQVYFENATNDIELPPGNIYVDKNKITATSAVQFPLPTYGSSLGGVALIYQTDTGATLQARSASTVMSVAQGLSGTNSLNLTTGHGSSFQVGSGVYAAGASPYFGMITNISTDTLTVTPTLTVGISNSLWRLWSTASTLAINASLMKLAHSIDLAAQSNFYSMSAQISSVAFYDPFGEWAIGIGSIGGAAGGLGVTSINNREVVLFNPTGATANVLGVEGRFSAAEIEFEGSGTFQATLSVFGFPAWSVSEGQTGSIKRTMVTNLGPGWNSFNLGFGASHGPIGIRSINLYKMNPDMGITFGKIASIETNQALIERSTYNASIMAPGLNRRIYADQAYLQDGSWGILTTGNPLPFRSYQDNTQNLQAVFDFFGQEFCLVGIGTNCTIAIALDGNTVGATFNQFYSASFLGWHTVTATKTNSAAGGQEFRVTAFDYRSPHNELKWLNRSVSTPVGLPEPACDLHYDTGNGYGALFTAARRYSTARRILGNQVVYSDSATLGTNFFIKKRGNYQISAMDRGLSSAVNVVIVQNPSSGVTTGYLLTYPQGFRAQQVTAALEFAGHVSMNLFLKPGDVVRQQASDQNSADYRTYFKITKVD